jgi:exodeoxyribonuclease V alpha subunit
MNLVKGTISFHHRKPDSEWALGSVADDVGSMTVVGLFPPTVEDGDIVELMGSVQEHARYGEQFKVDAVVAHLPGNTAAIEVWLDERLPHVGPERAAAIVAKFGTGLWRVLEDDADKLTTISGITAERAAQIVAAYEASKHEREVAIALARYAIPTTFAGKLIRAYGGDAVELFEDDPYILYTQCEMPFDKVDEIAIKKVRVSPTDPRRVSAMVRKHMKDALFGGDCYMVRHTLTHAVASHLNIKREDVDSQLEGFGVNIYDKWVMLNEIAAAEKSVAASIRELQNG